MAEPRTSEIIKWGENIPLLVDIDGERERQTDRQRQIDIQTNRYGRKEVSVGVK